MWEALVEPRDTADAESRRSSRLLATLLVVLIPLGLASGLVQLALVPGFAPTFAAMAAALTILSMAYGLARFGRFRAGTMLTCGAVSAACLGALAFNPQERLAPAFLLLAILLASVLLPLRHAITLALVDGGLLAAVAGQRLVSVPVLLASSVLFVIGSALALALSAHRARVELDRQAALTEAATKLRMADRLSSVGLLTAEIAHELGNPLTCSIWNLDLAMRQTTAAEPTQHLQLVQDGLRRVTAILERLKPMARREPATEQLIELAPAVEAALKLVQAYVSRRAQLVLEAHAMPYVYVNGDATRLGQVIVNLVMNAAHAVEHGGSRTPEVRVVLNHAAGWANITVEDTGPGIDRSVLPRIFDPFFTTKQDGEGTGLGLAIARDIVADLGGRIEVQSEPQQGARFVVHLPAFTEAQDTRDVERVSAMRMTKQLR